MKLYQTRRPYVTARGVLLFGAIFLLTLLSKISEAQSPGETPFIPDAVKVSRDGRIPELLREVYTLNTLNLHDDKNVFQASPCLVGEFYVGFQLYYDFGDRTTQIPWTRSLQIALHHGDDMLWTKTLSVDMPTQTFVATHFHDAPISCGSDYHFSIENMDGNNSPPDENIYLKVLLVPVNGDEFESTLTPTLACSRNGNQSVLSWDYAGNNILGFDIEWVFIDEYETAFTGNTPEQAFHFKEPVRVTAPGVNYTHEIYYPSGRIWYRIRALGYNPEAAGHRIPGEWTYSPEYSFENHEPGITWQIQSVYAEDGKYKQVIQYFDDTFRERESLVNLSTEQSTIVSQALYDYEGRKAVQVMGFPTSAGLGYRSNTLEFASQDPIVTQQTGTGRTKFNYDNAQLENSILANTVGASQYYSSSNVTPQMHQEMIPDAEGYVYSQTQFVNDGTGRISRQSGVGKEFRIDGTHATRYFYATASNEELHRLFGSNIGNAAHYKKNMVVDGNGQVSISYLDQEQRVVATALAGEKPSNVEAIPSYEDLSTVPLTVTLDDKNVVNGNTSINRHLLLNTAPTSYTFNYAFSSLASQVEGLGCESCTYDLVIVIETPDGSPVNLGTISQNESSDGFSFKRTGLTAADCGNRTQLTSIQFTVQLPELGDYTITKTLKAHEVTFDQVRTQLLQDPSIQQQLQLIHATYAIVDESECTVCDENCEGSQALIDEAITGSVAMDCENLIHQIYTFYQDQHPTVVDYQPTQAELEGHDLYCKYLLCSANQASEVFERKISMIKSWSQATSEQQIDLPALDPFFNVEGLSGFGHKTALNDKLAAVKIGPFPYDGNNDGVSDGTTTFQGTLQQVTNPLNTNFYINSQGVPDQTGFHVLYFDAMTKRESMGEAAYQEKIDQMHWQFYRNYYLEAKRKTKLDNIPAYSATECNEARKDLTIQDDLVELDTQEEMLTWGEDKGFSTETSDEEASASLTSIVLACDNASTISQEDNDVIIEHLKAYFDKDPKNLLKIIYTEDLPAAGNPGDSDLAAVEAILSGYGCTLAAVSQQDPWVCLTEETVTTDRDVEALQDYAENSSTTQVEAPADAQGMPQVALDIFQELEGSNTVNSKQKTLSSKSTSSLTTLNAWPDEYDALMDFYNSTGGPNWTNDTNWGTEDVSTWFGVGLDSEGHVENLSIIYNNLTGTLPNTLGDLRYLRNLGLAGNHIGGAIPEGIGELTLLTQLDLRFNDFSGAIPESIGNLAALQYLYLEDNKLESIPSSIANLDNLITLSLTSNRLTGGIPTEIGGLANIGWISLAGNPDLGGSIPPSIGDLSTIRVLSLYACNLTGSIPSEIGNLTNLEVISLAYNQLEGSIPASLVSLTKLASFNMNSNRLSGPIPPIFENSTVLTSIDVSWNDLSGPIPTSLLDHTPAGTALVATDNRFTFSDILPFHQSAVRSNQFARQKAVGVTKTIYALVGQSVSFTTSIDRNTDPASTYQWTHWSPVNTDGPDSHSFTLPSVSAGHSGPYRYTIRNSAVPDLALTSMTIYLSVVDELPNQVTICTEYDTSNPTLQSLSYTPDWEEEFQNCMQKAAERNSQLEEYAVDKFIEGEIETIFENYKTKCTDNLQEAFSYTYIPKEYHYTLYYYDQASTLVQTVPPAGVDPVNAQHGLATRYKYNSLNQLIWQKTPDAGESNFWYNDKGQLRLSQNAQQYIDGAYSYTRYDEQGRIVEVGELETALTTTALRDSIEILNFPSGKAPEIALNDVTYTHYDFPKEDLQGSFGQENLRSRVSFVEVSDGNSTERVSTYYSYDIHGNVKSLLQSIPGLTPKRTDYVYDLISGKVNYVMYQYGEGDQFTHHYTYDADNRLIKVFTSSDGFIWNTDAMYDYYAHGPLARVELGTFRVQAMDYYYTLQGWIKGVNMPFEGDPGEDGADGSLVGKDVFAYALGYYQNDYKPITTSITTPDTRDQLWTRHQQQMGNTGLYNGNISWMVTDLAKIGELANDRTKGMQGMLYKYDQLNRIMQGRSLTNYNATTGFDAHGVNPSAYDENYTYDPNGNILTLSRRDELASVKDDFNYQYYANTNKLREVKPGPSEGTYEYDAIGNLILDRDEDVEISWTPYGKVREVSNEDEEMVTTFRYDGSGNRIEKKVVKQEDGEEIVSLIRYIRDASGNVMAIYKDQVLQEQPIYGSSRLGMYKGGITAGQQVLGKKGYELSNHLGNVMAVISDKVEIDGDNVQATEISVNDYYPFGLNMAGRGWQSLEDDYRYGFNGKEKDSEEEWGTTNYDYGARIYDPKIGKFLSLDPQSFNYPGWSNYAFVRDSPLLRIDPSGKWDIEVHVYKDREKYGYGMAIVKNRHGEEVFRFRIRAEGVGGRNRMVEDSDTPLGTYEIPDNKAWITGGLRESYGPNPRLNLTGESGEISESGRDLIRIHGGRQETYNQTTKEWEADEVPILKKTRGCMRCLDTDIFELKAITDGLEVNDGLEIPGKLTIFDDLIEFDGQFLLDEHLDLDAELEKLNNQLIQDLQIKQMVDELSIELPSNGKSAGTPSNSNPNSTPNSRNP